MLEYKAELVVLGLGSNKGDSPRILREAVAELDSILGGMRQASLYKTAPLYVLDQECFLNTAVTGLYAQSPAMLLNTIHRLEVSFGRDRSHERRYGERTLDIDILLFGRRVVCEKPALEIPHPRLHERAFALVPLLELIPDAVDPRSGIPLQDSLDKLPLKDRDISLI
ncbi:MAG: 2-amino-4-hydroxy-6-hydroxymethyldihydropteridine diphosphokinase [Spirochaetaceae bacterium]|jgi:2-amino-4-hydroxy-6-hydroxymethyldihydropteridine diphosphokinase|nr:2-amino-4-hydroxy-6-hydroxymethyldihydropteridine diphosphokinase [Spirochaetaceae bacterium]